MKNCFAIASVTFKEIIRQPIYYVIILSGIILLLLTSCFTLFAFGDESRLIKDMGATTITLSGLIIAVFYTANSFSTDFQKSTVVTILCKTVTKSSFIIGKFSGTIFAIFIVNIVLIVVFASIMAFYNSWTSPQENLSFFENIFIAMDNHLLVGVYFAFLQVVILGAISLLLSVLFSPVSNISICFTIYIFGHLGDYFNSYFVETTGFLMWFPKLIFTIVPNLQLFDINSMKLNAFPSHDLLLYLLTTSFYTICYCAIMIVFTIFSFKKKEMI